MEVQRYDDFKYIIQDTYSVYFGKELTYTEMMDRQDVPFKFKTIISVYVAKDTALNVKLTDHLLKLSKEEFSFRIYEQLKLMVRVCYKAQKKGIGGKVKEKWEHKACSLEQFCEEYREAVLAGDMEIEEVSISKLALMFISI